jgi:hypothetical protein
MYRLVGCTPFYHLFFEESPKRTQITEWIWWEPERNRLSAHAAAKNAHDNRFV